MASFTPTKRRRTHLRALILAAIVSAPLSPMAAAREVPPDVDLELVLAVDVSSSMTAAEQAAQRGGYVGALRDPDVLRLIKAGLHGRIAIAYVEWARPTYQRVVMPWTVVDGSEDARTFALALGGKPITSEGGTSISGGLLMAGTLFETTLLRSDRKVVDISGDGPNNAGPPVDRVRDALTARGITINGLAISLGRNSASDREVSFGERTTAWYYEQCVVGGPAAFVLAVRDAADFAKVIRRKLMTEIADVPPQKQLAAFSPRVADCSTLGQSPGR